MHDPRRIALVTAPAYDPLPPDELVFADALARRGLEPVVARWDDERRWGDYGAVVIRSCWDYHRRAALFDEFLDRLEAQRALVVNPLPILRWNTHKAYLRELEAAGVATVETRWLARSSAATLEDLARETGWHDLVIKPVVSASGEGTWRVAAAGTAGHEARFAAQLAASDLMVQPFVGEIASAGEHSLVFLDGAFSHAVLKKPRHPEFRVQEEHGGTAERVSVAQSIVREAGQAIAAAPGRPLYARVDGVIRAGRFILSELELVEPTLYFRFGGDFADRMAAAVGRLAGAD